MTWSKESREKQSNRFINPFLVLDYINEIVGVYRNSKQCERESEFGFSSLGIRQALNKIHKSHKGFRFEKKLVLNSIKNIGEE